MQMMTNLDFKSYIAQQKRIKEHRNHKINNSFGVYDAYRWIRKNKWLDIERPLTTKEFYSIIREVNNLLAYNLIECKDIIFPCTMGKLEIRKSPRNIRFINGKVTSNLPVDWDKTLKLWYKDEVAKENKSLIKVEEKEIYKIIYNKSLAKYNNKTFYSFSPNREIKINLKNNIKQGKVDAFKKY